MNFPSIRLEGAILTSDLLDAIAREDKHSQKAADFGLEPSTKVKDEIASTWSSAKALWTGYQAKIAALHEGQTGVSETRNLFMIPLLALLGYQLEKADAEIVNDKSYAISHRDISRDGFPLHIMGWHDNLEKKRESGGPRISSHALVQEYLNLTEHAYGIITNGCQLRLLRDSSRLIKLSFLEFDLNRIFEEDLYADFAILFRLIHATRMPVNRSHASGAIIEKYHQESVDSGSRIRDGLAAAVAYSMQTVANGLLAHPANVNLVHQLKNEPARTVELHQNLLRWVYRTLFVLVIEERVLHHAPTATLRQRQLYRDYYSLQRLRRLADRPQLADRRAHDLWRAMHQTLRLYEDGGKGLPLGIAPLGSFLFREEGLQQLFKYQLDNRSLLQALNRLSTFTHPDTNVRMRVNYGALDVEEFGSVYESLLALRPRVIPEGDKFSFGYAQLAGNERKTSGSYYTPDSLVQCLLDSALDPVIEERLARKKGQEAEKALLTIKVCDKAVGSGHFLIGAAHRLARRLAEIRAGEEALSPDVQRNALRDVVSHCLYGVDINPLAVELCKVSLWMLAMEPGKPLSFLDHHIRCGNSLLGATPELIAEGIPENAFEAIEGDDKSACSSLKKLNKAQREGLRHLFIAEEAAIRDRLHQAAAAIEELGDDSPEAVRHKETAFKNAEQNYDFQKARDLANLWCAAFVIKKHFPSGASIPASCEPLNLDDQPLAMQGGLFGGPEELPKAKGKKTKMPRRADSEIPIGITTQHLHNFVKGGELPNGLLAEAKRFADQFQFFHFHLAFPEVFAQGGFDVSLGNPPWERIKLQEEEWFAERMPQIAMASNASIRRKLIKELEAQEPALHGQFLEACREAYGIGAFLRNSGRYPLCGRGDINTYAIFAELNRSLISPHGRAGFIVPTGIATDDTTKHFFCDLVTTQCLSSLYSFENEAKIFPDVHNETKFCLLTLAGRKTKSEHAQFFFFARHVEDLSDQDRVFSLTKEEVALLNPTTGTCPVFRSARDAELAKLIYRRCELLGNDGENNTAWNLTIRRVFDMNKSESLEVCNRVDAKQWPIADSIPMYEAKMIHIFDHRFGTYSNQTEAQANKGKLPELTEANHRDPNFGSVPRFALTPNVVKDRLSELWQHDWMLVWRDVTNAVVYRTVIAAIVPFSGTDFTLRVGMPKSDPKGKSLALLSIFNSLVFDYCARQKIGGIHLSDYVLRQLPVPSHLSFSDKVLWSPGPQKLSEWLTPRVLELTYTAWNLEAFAQDCGWPIPPFRWDEERRFLLRCELDAAFFHLYLGREVEWRQQPEALTKAFPTPRHAVDYILDTFPIVKRKDEAKFNGDYRTKRTILEIYDALADSIRTGQPYQTQLTPLPASYRVAHPPRLPTIERQTLGTAEKFLLIFIDAFLRQTHQEATFELLDSVFHLLRHRKNHAAQFESAVGNASSAWLSAFNDMLPNDKFVPFLRRLESDGWIEADRRTGRMKPTEKFPSVPHDPWRNYDVSAALRVIAQQPDIAKLVIAEPETPLAAKEFGLSA